MDFLALSETWLNTNIPTNMIDVLGYICYRKDRLSGKGGGVLVYIREIFKCSVIELETFGLECFILNIVLSARINFNIMVLYNPPSQNDLFYLDFVELFKLFNCHTETTLLGDFNINCFK